MKQGILALTVIAAATLISCASAPGTKTGAAPVAASPPPAKIASDHQIDAIATPTELRDAASNGYQIVVIDGDKRYCTTERYTGSRVQKTTRCLTEAGYQAQQDKAKNFIETTQAQGRFGTPCVTGTGGGAVGC